MNKRIVVGLACALVAGLGPFQSAFAQSSSSSDYRHADVTVVAIAPDGTWGTATDSYSHLALNGAINNCKKHYKEMIG
jgi:hypothetical protein